MSEITITPKQHQMIFDLADVSEVFYGGSAGGGKSEGLLAFCLHRRIACPGSVGLALRRTFPELEKSLIRKSYHFFGEVAKYNESKKTWYFSNGSIQEFGYCQNERDVYQYQSAEYDDIEFDELTHFTNYQYLYMLSRLRSSRGGWKTLVRSASNPGNIGHKWVKDRFVIPAKNKIHEITDEEGNIRTLYFLPATLGDNTLMSEEKQREYRSWLNTLPETEKQQLREGIWEEIPMEGAYYMDELTLAQKQGRITRVPYVQSLPVDTYWDLGIDDSTTIWFIQALHSGEIRVIDYYEQSGEGLTHYAKILRDLPYVYRNHFMPHDVEVRELGTGISRKDTALGLGIKPIETVKRARDNEAVMTGIEAARNILSRCWFDVEKCEKGIEALKNYRKEWDEANQIFKTKPLHDWSSHAADAFRTFSMGFKDFSRAKKPVQRQVCTLAA